MADQITRWRDGRPVSVPASRRSDGCREAWIYAYKGELVVCVRPRGGGVVSVRMTEAQVRRALAAMQKETTNG